MDFTDFIALTNMNLADLCEALRIKLENHHDACADAVACAQAMIRIIQGDKPDPSLVTLKEKSRDPFHTYERVKGDVLRPNLEVVDKFNPFYTQKVVFTGVMDSIGRQEAATILKELGADIDNSITRKTRYVIMGAGAGPSKLKKIEEFQAMGTNIEIVREHQFLKMIGRNLTICD
jgi:DNA polymerase III subunit epsilon